jgi:hypothetical protein
MQRLMVVELVTYKVLLYGGLGCTAHRPIQRTT